MARKCDHDLAALYARTPRSEGSGFKRVASKCRKCNALIPFNPDNKE